MKRLLALAAAAATLVTALPAQAAPVDPAKALKKQFVPGHGVTISETSASSAPDRRSEVSRITGSVEFGRSGPAASDITLRSMGKQEDRVRILSVGGHYYVRSPLLVHDLPMGKTWVLMDSLKGKPRFSEQRIAPLAPMVPKSLVEHAKSVKDGLYRGSLTYEQARAIGGDQAFDYRLTLNSQGLPVRFVSSRKSGPGTSWPTYTSETRLSDWGAEIMIKEPPADEVISSSELEDEALAELDALMRDIPNGSANSLGKIK
ncbi:MAG: hypothetical protein HOV96_12755 [Nonomuraea sp.]|nr:hypothetical protein [Nonomuraea sp.]NUP78404.1 hypothetical protein [Nonomuraea sp.]NUS07456.1 hypothetical protein [Nonomuraea sp.]